MAEFSSEEVAKELIRQVRGSRSQRSFSRALGFGSNVAYAWETGRRFPEVSVFFRAAETARLPVQKRVLEFLRSDSPNLTRARFSSPKTVQHIVEELVGQGQKRQLAERLGVDRTTLARWLRGQTEPRLPEFLRLVDVTTQRWLTFVSLFADPRKLPSARAAYDDMRSQQKLAYDLPWSHAILRALELDAYRSLPHHQPGHLAKQIGIGAEEEAHYLDELANAGQIRWTGTHWEVQRILTVDTRQDPKKNQELKRHWASVGLTRIAEEGTSPDALFSFNLFAIAEDSFQRIRELHLEYYDRVRAIIDDSPCADRVVLMNLQLVPLAPTNGSERGST